MNARHASLTHVGRVRTSNEDAFLVLPKDGIYAVADGMGGHEQGEVASALAIEALAANRRAFRHAPPKLTLRTAFNAANDLVLGAGDPRRAGKMSYRGPGTTLTACYLDLDTSTAWIGHVGDSRCYFIRDGVGQQVTDDHKNMWGQIQNCLGVRPGSHVGTDVIELAVCPGDVILLATDGLTNDVGPHEAAGIVRAGGGLDEIVAALISRALDRGGHDNATVVAVEILP